MKKIFSLLIIVSFTTISYSQCISGNTNITIGQTVNFSSLTVAQCSSCYDWDINNNSTSSDNSIVGNLQIVGSDMNQIVSIKGLALGTASLQLTYFDETGCHNCSTIITVIPVGANCCSPVLTGTFECRGSGTGHEGGILGFEDPINCVVDWTKISQLNIQLNGATFTGTTLNSKTLNGPFTIAPGFSVYGTSATCAYGHSFGAIVTFTYSNGCPNIVKSGNFTNINTPPTVLKQNNQIIISPNPTNSLIKFEGENLSNYKVSIFNNSGIEIIKNMKIDQNISLEKQEKGVYIYVLTDDKGYKQEGKIIKE